MYHFVYRSMAKGFVCLQSRRGPILAGSCYRERSQRADTELQPLSFSYDGIPECVARKAAAGAAVIAVLLISLAGLNVFIPATRVSAHNILHHLNFLPLMIAGMLFGWRGAAGASGLAAAVNLPIIARHWVEWPVDAKDQVIELIIFSFAGLIAGYLADRELAHRQSLEKTRQELESVYLELRAKHC